MVTCAVNKIDSNIVSARYAWEECIGQLPTVPTWLPLDPNSYSEFGGQTTTVARNPINDSRQRKKGVVVDLDATGGFNQDLTTGNSEDLLQGYLFADIRVKPEYLIAGTADDLEVTTTGNFATITSTVLDFTTLNLIPGEWIFVGGDIVASQFANAANNGFKRVRSVAANALVLDKSTQPMVDDTGAGKTVPLYLGRVLKNETGALIKRRSMQLERTLGSLDGLDPPQSEYLVGSVSSEWTLNASTASIVNIDYGYVATDNEQRTQVQGLKPGTRPVLEDSDAYNSSSDITRIKLALAGGVDEAPTPLFGYSTDLTLNINNNLSPNKALGVLGAFDVSAGTFAVSGSMTAYFSDISAVMAVRQNADVTLDIIFVKGGKGVVIDVPLLALGDGRLNVELDQPIMLPLTHDAASASIIDPNLNHTLLFTFFDNLPAAAE